MNERAFGSPYSGVVEASARLEPSVCPFAATDHRLTLEGSWFQTLAATRGNSTMPVFIRLIRFTEAGLDAVGQSAFEVMKKTLGAIQAVDAKVVGAFVTLGTYDVVSLLEAKDEAHVSRVDHALGALGYYIIVEQAGAVPLNEFVELSKAAPVFVTAWLQGRRALQVDRKPKQATTGEGRAASPRTTRAKGVDERKTKRAVGKGVFVAWLGSEGPFTITDYTVAPADSAVLFSFFLPLSSVAAAELLKVERKGEVKGVIFGVVEEKSRTPVPATLCRMDPAADGSHQVVLKAVLPKASFERIQKRALAVRPT